LWSSAVKTKLLSDEAFHSTMVDPMTAVANDDDVGEVDIWTYIDAIPDSEFDCFTIGNNDVMAVRRTGDGRYDHVLIPTETTNVFLVIVVDLAAEAIFGHHLLNLNDKYGLETPGRR
jgi:hypothetical protein